MNSETHYSVYQNSPFNHLFSGNAQKVKNFVNSHAEAEKKKFEVYKLTTTKDTKMTVTDFLVEATKKGAQ